MLNFLFIYTYGRGWKIIGLNSEDDLNNILWI